jgi:ABC-type nickel/cobalt efflux system permease component RcnA
MLFFSWTSSARAHPVPRNSHDRVVIVRLTPDALVVDYHLEIDEWTVVFKDVPALLDKDELAKLKTPKEFYDTFTRQYAPILAGLLTAKLDDQTLELKCVEEKYKVADSLQCDFVFRAPWQLPAGNGRTFSFYEGNFLLEPARVNLSLGRDLSIEVTEKVEPSDTLKKRSLIELKPGDDAKLRTLKATIRWEPPPVEELLPPPTVAADPLSPNSVAKPGSASSLLNLLLDTQRGIWMLLWLAVGLGAIHALTPGHGKTLVAAYLVGERGTVWHALLLGLATTLTHTGIVLGVAALLPLFFSGQVPSGVDAVLGFVGGLLVAGLGGWLLLCRLTNRPDHVHLGGHGHHHHHGHPHHDHHGADHYHDETGTAHPVSQATEPVGLKALILLGITGGIVPCPEAIVMFVFAIRAQRLWLAFPLLLAFSAGLAAVLIAIGILVVRVKGIAGVHWGESRFFRSLPISSAAVVTVLGLWLCYDSVHHTP